MPIVTPWSGGRDMRAELLPPGLLPLFDDRFVRSCDLVDEYVRALARAVLCEAELEGDGRDRVAAGMERAVDWLARAARGEADAPPPREPSAIAVEQEAHDPSALPTYRIAAAAAAAWPAVLRGETRGDAALFSPENAALWPEYFSNDNPLYAINNRVGALAARQWLPPGPLRILELGGGLGSASLALLDALAAEGRLDDVAAYRFTELAPPFLRRAQRTLAARHPGLPFEYARLDIDLPLAGQGIAPESVDLAWAVNTVHVAKDLSATLAGLRAALRPGGLLVLGECLRPFPGTPVYPEFVFLLLDPFRAPRLDPVLRPEPGFLTPEAWLASLRAAGFATPRVFPDVARIRGVYPAFFVGALGAWRP
jgi:SAM-dependent methyltransferase